MYYVIERATKSPQIIGKLSSHRNPWDRSRIMLLHIRPAGEAGRQALWEGNAMGFVEACLSVGLHVAMLLYAREGRHYGKEMLWELSRLTCNRGQALALGGQLACVIEWAHGQCIMVWT